MRERDLSYNPDTIQTQYRWFVRQENEHAIAMDICCTVIHVNTRVYTGGQQTKFNQLPACWGRNRPILPVKPLWLPSPGPQNNIGPLINEDCRPAWLRGYQKIYPRKFDLPPPKYVLPQNALRQTVVEEGGLIKVEGALDPKPV